MPEPYDLDAVKARQETARAQAIADYAPDEPDTEHLTPTAIAHCDRCDDQGYRGLVICDHQNHFADTETGRALVHAELDKIRQRKTDQARGTESRGTQSGGAA